MVFVTILSVLKKILTGISISIIAFFCVTATACSSDSSSYLLYGLKENSDEQKQLLELLAKNPKNQETRFALMNRVANNLLTAQNNVSLVLFLTTSVENYPDNPYNAYWLLMTAHIYLQNNAPKIAKYYFERILKNCPDLEIQGRSLHLVCLENLIKITDSPELHIRYYTELITRFPSNIDAAQAYFMLARAYEKLGEWDLAIQTYTQFLSYGRFDIQVPGIPNSYEYAKQIVDYNSSSKDWTFETLDELVTSIKRAIDTYNYRALDSYRAKVNFFAMSWKQTASDKNSQVDFQMRDFMAGNRIRYSAALDSSSTPYEAYLRTWGWYQNVSVWYLYFRKVNFPADPEIHGRWEWAGIYYGDKV
ncbi:tetratricopeptide repeat protein [Brucepastera parasyntrophica]|uniref:tetratricopeptide repeat protein n=1 Tax=Brucepastera parasyntrophica TaxID=2880008 RepID=UPI002108AA8B|nr:tetratricopeptide repeat protein [Brucepastera parasyntrophica]ULQ60374.1 tetratricopeptide repeat protein [Brucepastera parasyntrophica]